MTGFSGNGIIYAAFLGISSVFLIITLSISNETSLHLIKITDHSQSFDHPREQKFSLDEDHSTRLEATSNHAEITFPGQQKNRIETTPSKMGTNKNAVWPTVDKDSTGNRTINENERSPGKDGAPLSVLYPFGLFGGYRNQVLRFIGFLKYAFDEKYDSIFLPTLVFSTRYFRFTRFNEAKEKETINPVLDVWPIPFDEIFDIDFWNSFSRRKKFSLPKLVSSVLEDETDKKNRAVCWNSQPNKSVVSLEAIQHKNPNFKKSVLPLLTRRMLFGSDEDENRTMGGAIPSRKSFLLEPVQADAIELLTGIKVVKQIHKIDFSEAVKNCTHPRVFGGKTRVLWNAYSSIDLMARNFAKKKKMRKKLGFYHTLIETVTQALVPAKPWRILADNCIEHHLGFGANEFSREEDDPHVIGHDHGYIVLHSRVEPEMLSHACGFEMERNLTKILDLVELLALDYNSPDGLPDYVNARANQLSYSSPISNTLRHQLNSDLEHRPLKGALVAISREELEDINSFPKFKKTTRYNRDVLNQRSVSYDIHGNQTYSKTLEAREHEQQRSTKTISQRLTEEKASLPIFECGHGWMKHAFYDSESRQKKLFTPASTSTNVSKDFGLYYKYGPQKQQDGKTIFPLLPLPDNYFGDLIPSVLNFWLAVQADVFVGVRRSSWSTDVWTTRYYMGKGGRNFEYTSKNGIRSIGNNGLPEPHRNCNAQKQQKERAEKRRNEEENENKEKR